jgi:organic radical activating enzyme
MFGKNPIRPAVNDDGSVLQVVEIFPTIQGEGHRAGQPAIFVRLGGCNLACNFCDTEFETFSPMRVDEVVEKVGNSEGIKLAVITGGEPLRQNIVPLCNALIAESFTVQIETNGTLWRPLPDAVEIVCSPKNTGQGYMPIRPDVLARVTSLKYIVSATHPHYRDVPENPASKQVFVQPMDEYDAEKNAANQKHAAALAMQHGYRLSLQLHKILNIP